MSQVLYGARVYQVGNNPVNLNYNAIGKNSEVFTDGDIVGLTSGDLLVKTSVSVGVITKTVTMASDNVTVAKVAPGYVPIQDEVLFLMGTNSDLTSNAVDGGTYYSIAGLTGAQQVDVSKGVQTGVTRSVMIVEVDPFNEGGTGSGSGLRQVVVRLLRTPWTVPTME